MKNAVLVLDGVRSVHNVGSLFRTADGAGVSRIVLSGYTPGPLDRFGRERKDFVKVSLGAEKSVPWSRVETVEEAIAQLKAEGYVIAMIEQDARSQSIFQWQSPVEKPLAIMLGNEVLGVLPHTLQHADVILEIPMRGEKESLNVSVAGGIALYVLLR